MLRMSLRRLNGYIKPRSQDAVLRRLNFRPQCEFVGVFLRYDRPALEQSCSSPGDFVMVTRCCEQPIVLCKSHLKTARTSEWLRCGHCQTTTLVPLDSSQVQRISQRPAS